MSHKAKSVAANMAMNIIANTPSELPAGAINTMAKDVYKLVSAIVEQCAQVAVRRSEAQAELGNKVEAVEDRCVARDIRDLMKGWE